MPSQKQIVFHQKGTCTRAYDVYELDRTTLPIRMSKLNTTDAKSVFEAFKWIMDRKGPMHGNDQYYMVFA